MKQGITQYYESKCLVCSRAHDAEFMRTKRAHANYRKEEYRKQREKYQADPRLGMLERARKRARRDGCAFELVLDDIVLPERCPLLGFRLVVNQGGLADDSYSLDKIDPAKGYVRDNIMVMSNMANAMKNRANPVELRMFCHNMLQIIGEG
jgi:hypothetical protein